MKRIRLKKIISFILALALLVSSNTVSIVANASKVKNIGLSKTKVEVSVGSKKEIKILANKKYHITKARVIKNTNKKAVSIKIKGSKIKISGKKAGKAKVKLNVKYKYNKSKIKNKKLNLTVKVKKGKKPSNTEDKKLTWDKSGMEHPSECKITFNSNGGTKIDDLIVTYGEAVKEPVVPVKKGYVFCAWYTDKDFKYIHNFNDGVYNNMNLYAKWLKNSDDTCTRSEWIKKLVDSFKFELSYPDRGYAFSDIEKDKNALQIQTAYTLGLLPDERLDKEQDVPHFYPNKKVTREYMAYTVVKALGFELVEDDLQISDLSDTNYPEEVKLAVKTEIMQLYDNKFEPKRNVTVTDVKYTLARVMDDWIASENKEIQPHNNSKFAKDVIDLSDVSDYSIEESNGRYVLALKSSVTEDIKTGSVIVLGETDEETECAVKVVQVLEDGKYICEEPRVEEVFSKIDVCASSIIDYNDIKHVSEADIDVASLENSKTKLKGKRVDVKDKECNVPKIGYKFDAGTNISDRVDFNGEIAVNVSEIKYTLRADYGLGVKDKVDEFKVSMTEKVGFKGGLYYSGDSSDILNDFKKRIPIKNKKNVEKIFQRVKSKGKIVTKKLELKRIKAKLPYNFNIVITPYIRVQLDGELSVNYSMNFVRGFSYKSGIIIPINDRYPNEPELTISGSVGIYLGADIAIRYLVVKIVVCNFEVGLKFEGSIKEPSKSYNKTLYCGDFQFKFIFHAEIKKEGLLGFFTIGGKIELEKEFNLGKPFHIENFQVVDKCTNKKSSTTTANTKGRENKNVKDAQYNFNKKGTKNSGNNNIKRGDSDILDNYSEETVRTVYSDENGNINVDELDEGIYSVEVSADGYKKCTIDNIKIEADTVNSLGTIQLVERENKAADIDIAVISAVTGERLDDCSYEIKSQNSAYNVEKKTGTIGLDGISDSLEVGNYNITIKKDGYIEKTSDFTVSADENQQIVIVMSPIFATNQDSSFPVRIVLTWENQPKDLDAHLCISNITGDKKVIDSVCFENEKFENDKTSINLDLDNKDITTNVGKPETITIEKMSQDYLYTYYVYQYTADTDDFGLSESNAKVEIYIGDELLYEIYLPEEKEADSWKVFEYNPVTDDIKIFNKLGYGVGDEFQAS